MTMPTTKSETFIVVCHVTRGAVRTSLYLATIAPVTFTFNPGHALLFASEAEARATAVSASKLSAKHFIAERRDA